MPSYTFAPATLRPARPTPPGAHDALADAVIATADAGGSIEVTPAAGASAAKMINSFRNAVRNRCVKRQLNLTIRVKESSGKVYLWCEKKSAPRQPDPLSAKPPADLNDTERRVLRALTVNELETGEGYALDEIVRSVYGRNAVPAMKEAVRAALGNLCARRLLLQDRNLRYSVVPAK